MASIVGRALEPRPGPLLDRDRLREVSGLIDVEPLGGREFARENLQRDDREQRREQSARFGVSDHDVGVRLNVGIALFRDHEREGAASANLLNIRDDLRVQ